MQDQRLIKNVLEAIEAFLKLDSAMGTRNTENSLVLALEKAGGLDALEEV